MDDFLLFIVCVVYNKTVKEIVSYNQFVKSSIDNKCVKFIVVDNSTEKDVVNVNMKMGENLIYLNSNGNVGLSKAYNNVLRYIDSQKFSTKNIWVMLADDDTDFSQNYLNNLIKTIESFDETCKNYALISTNIKSNYGCMSPFSIKGLKIRAFEGKCGACYSDVYAINSGLCIKRDLLKLIGDYDETLFLDYVDVYFFDRVRKIGKDCLLIIDGDVHQKFSAVQKEKKVCSKKRFFIFKKDFTQYCKATKKSKFFWLFVLCKRWLNIVLKGI